MSFAKFSCRLAEIFVLVAFTKEKKKAEESEKHTNYQLLWTLDYMASIDTPT